MKRVFKLVAVLAVASGLVLGTVACEDDPNWNCRTQGNHYCGNVGMHPYN